MAVPPRVMIWPARSDGSMVAVGRGDGTRAGKVAAMIVDVPARAGVLTSVGSTLGTGTAVVKGAVAIPVGPEGGVTANVVAASAGEAGAVGCEAEREGCTAGAGEVVDRASEAVCPDGVSVACSRGAVSVMSGESAGEAAGWHATNSATRSPNNSRRAPNDRFNHFTATRTR